MFSSLVCSQASHPNIFFSVLNKCSIGKCSSCFIWILGEEISYVILLCTGLQEIFMIYYDGNHGWSGRKKSVETSESKKEDEEKRWLCFHFSLKQLELWNHVLQREFQSNFLKEGASFKTLKGSRSLFQMPVIGLIYIFKSESSNWLNY